MFDIQFSLKTATQLFFIQQALADGAKELSSPEIKTESGTTTTKRSLIEPMNSKADASLEQTGEKEEDETWRDVVQRRIDRCVFWRHNDAILTSWIYVLIKRPKYEFHVTCDIEQKCQLLYII